jgi:diaminopimelate dehydrogenase
MKIGIVGYGNLGKGVEACLTLNPDMELAAVFTRRKLEEVHLHSKNVSLYSLEDAVHMKDAIDVMINCGGSATDLPVSSPELAAHFNLVDSYDTHAKINEHFEKVDQSARKGKKLSIISGGWDPGMFSLIRLYSLAILPAGKGFTFWGKGVSQGHSDAIRRVPGVLDAREYTIPKQEALDLIRSGKNPELTTREKHLRECYVVTEEGADNQAIEQAIKTMPNYFANYDTIVHFITQEELRQQHSGLPHGGFVIHSGSTGWHGENKHTIEYSLKLDSNPEFTASVLVALARAAYRMGSRGETGCKTIFDVPPCDLAFGGSAELRAHLL